MAQAPHWELEVGEEGKTNKHKREEWRASRRER